MSSEQVEILDDFAAQAAERLIVHCSEVIGQRSHVHLALTGGRTAQRLYSALAAQWKHLPLDVGRVTFWQGDERCVPPGHPDSNWGMIERTLLSPLDVPAEQCWRMRAESADQDAAASRYESELRSVIAPAAVVPELDLILLGLGADGHVASLFPGTPALLETHRLVVPNPVPQLGTGRMTFTYPLINTARAVWVIVTGDGKAGIARRALIDGDASLPVTHVRPASAPIRWLLDRAAARDLHR